MISMNSRSVAKRVLVLLGAAAIAAQSLCIIPTAAADASYIIYNDEGLPAEDGKPVPRSYLGVWAASSPDFGDLIHNERYADYDKIECIDVSYHQGLIDWNAVAADGIGYAYIRIGFRGYGTGNIAADPRFAENFIGAKQAGLKVGVYFYTQALSTEEAAEEARYVLDVLGSYSEYTIDLPIYYDVEPSDTHGEVGRVEAAGLTSADFTANCHAFCQTIRSAGYDAGIYTCRDWFENQLNTWELAQNYNIWLAHYTRQTSYAGHYDIWQYSKSSHVSGIDGYVDRDVIYVAPNGSNTAPDSPVQAPEITLTPPDPSEITGVERSEITLAPPDLSEITGVESSEVTLAPPDLNEITGISNPNIFLALPEPDKIGTYAAHENDSPALGDCNLDGLVNAADASDILTYAASLGSISPAASPNSLQWDMFDFNGDGTVNAADAADLLCLCAFSGAED